MEPQDPNVDAPANLKVEPDTAPALCDAVDAFLQDSQAVSSSSVDQNSSPDDPKLNQPTSKIADSVSNAAESTHVTEEPQSAEPSCSQDGEDCRNGSVINPRKRKGYLLTTSRVQYLRRRHGWSMDSSEARAPCHEETYSLEWAYAAAKDFRTKFSSRDSQSTITERDLSDFAQRMDRATLDTENQLIRAENAIANDLNLTATAPSGSKKAAKQIKKMKEDISELLGDVAAAAGPCLGLLVEDVEGAEALRVHILKLNKICAGLSAFSLQLSRLDLERRKRDNSRWIEAVRNLVENPNQSAYKARKLARETIKLVQKVDKINYRIDEDFHWYSREAIAEFMAKLSN